MSSGDKLARKISDKKPSPALQRFGIVTGIEGMAETPPTIEVDVGASGVSVPMRFTRGWVPVVGVPVLVLWDGEDPVAAQGYSNYRTDWESLTLINGWVNYADGVYEYGGYRRVGDIVYLRGLIKNGAGGTVAARLPAGYTPPFDLVFPVIAGNLIGRVTVQSDGDLLVENIGSFGFLSLDGIFFSVTF